MPRVVCAAAYVALREKMKFLWDKSLRLNTVHMSDVCRALWHVAEHEGSVGETYNLADKGDTDQGKVNDILANLFGIKTGFQGKLISNMARMDLTRVVNEVNEKHLKPWSDLCKVQSIYNTPLSPFIDKELLYQNHLFIDGSKIESTGFKYEVPELTEDNLMEVVQSYIDTKMFPPIIGTGPECHHFRCMVGGAWP
jgi:nucleoside-diphosphate-sugar epimerase